VALFALIAIWAVLLRVTWAAWGDLTIDSGHEMYVPAMLAAGKMLYRDIWFMYPPAAPYFNSYLFQIFGIHLNVLYWAGSLAALGSAIFLYLAGMSLGSWLIGWTAGAVVLVEAFGQSLFCFPLPYGFSAVYGCFTACLFLWFIVEAIRSGRFMWMVGAGTAAAVALLLKLEFGVACYGTLLLLIVADSWRQRSWTPLWAGALASLPGVMACVLVARWMISIGGADFITQENFQSWPTSYFMKVYGKAWLQHTGFDLSAGALLAAFGRICMFAAVVIGLRWLLRRNQNGGLALLFGLGVAAFAFLPVVLLLKTAVFLTENTPVAAFICVAIFIAVAIALRIFVRQKRDWGALLFATLGLSVAAAACLTPVVALKGALLLRRIFFPADMVAIVGLAALACWWFRFRRGLSSESLAICAVFTLPVLLAFRILMRMEPAGYPIYYNGTVILAFLFLLSALVAPRSAALRSASLRGELLVCCCCLLCAIADAPVFAQRHERLARLETERGVVRTRPDMVLNYQQAIAFMKEKAAAGESVLSIPEDTSLYFLSGTMCPIRVTQFTPGVLVPGKMTQETVREIEQKNVQYLLWSNRTSAEYGVPLFGKDYDAAFAGYLTSHYRPVGPLIRNSENGWAATVWERIGHENEIR
jgi:preprotein translocase subunit SecG